MSRPDYVAPRSVYQRNGFEDLAGGLSQVVGTLAECKDVPALTAVLQQFLGCDVELLFAPVDGDLVRAGGGVLHNGDSCWMSVPLLFDRTRLGWLRARSEALPPAGANVMAVAGRIASCLLWEQARAHRAWVSVLDGTSVAEHELAAAVRESGIQAGAALAVMACFISTRAGGDHTQGATAQGQSGSYWFKCWLKFDRPSGLQPLCFVRGQRVALFAPIDQAEAARGASGLTTIARGLQRSLRHQHDGEVAVGIGGATSEVDCLPRLWRDAVRALDLGTAMGGRSAVSNVDSLGVMGLMLEHVPATSLASACSRMLGPLLDHDAQKGTDFCRTLRVFLDSDCRFAEAARVLYVHENTLRHRVKRIEEATGVALADPYVRANLYLCLKLMDLGFHDGHHEIEDQQGSEVQGS